MVEKMRVLYIAILMCCLTGASLANGVRHEMAISLVPEQGALIVTDHLELQEAVQTLVFELNSGLEARTDEGHLRLLERGPYHSRYHWTSASPLRHLTLRYQGRPLFSPRQGHGGMPEGDLSTDGVYLDGASAWYPLLADQEITGIRLTIREPAGWKALSAGGRAETLDGVVWESPHPQQDLYLVAGPYHRHARQMGDITLSVWLLEDDPTLAERYLSLMGEYLRHYGELIGPYPYAKFAVVENRWPTGLGMSSFTLLGSQVLRLPFIPYTSLPHEILHNWWGNGVWVDYRKGNWSEGLTAYLADHWMKEREGKGAEYRLRALQRYSNFAAQGQDMPLLAFVSRHDDASQSVGYSKSLMFFHMLRRALGDPAFEAALRRLWQRHRFERIGFRTAVATLLADRPALLDRFLPWLERTGAPRLILHEVSSRAQGSGHRLDLTLGQSGTAPLELLVPVAVDTTDGRTHRKMLRLYRRKQSFQLDLDARPVRLRVDPDYDVLRYLDPSEQPPVLSLLFGGRTWLVLPSRAPAAEKAAWQKLARAWQARYPRLTLVWDDAAGEIPAEANRLLLGWSNRLFRPETLSDRHYRITSEGLAAGDESWHRDEFAVVRVVTDAGGRTTGLIAATQPRTIDALARKLPHYGGYGVLAFDEHSAQNRLKVVPENPHSRLTVRLAP